MNSILKIIVDLQCFVYCDFEQIGEAIPNSMLKVELRKGTYIIDFKKDDLILKSIKYKIESNNEDYLLDVSLADIYAKEKEKIRRKNISRKDVIWIDAETHWRILSVDDSPLNLFNGESWIDLPDNYNLLPMGQHRDPDVDVCGYIPFNIGGTLIKDDLVGYFINGGLWGCLDKSGSVVIQPIYGSKVFFKNEQVTSIWNGGLLDRVINYLGETVFSEFDNVFPIDEVVGCYDVSRQDKHGILNKYGEIITPIKYSELRYHANNVIWAQDSLSSKWGLIKYDSTIVLPFVYDDVEKANDGYFVCKNGKWGATNFDGKSIIDIIYRVVAKVTRCYENPNNPSAYEDSDYIYTYYSIVSRDQNDGCKYGIVNTHFDNCTKTISFKEIISCKYDAIYSNFGKQYTEEELLKESSSQLGAIYGYFSKEDVYFVIKKEHMQCDKYDDDNNVVYSFMCDEFNDKFKVLSSKYYIRNTDLTFDSNPFDWLDFMDFYDGTLFVKRIYPDDWDGQTSVPFDVENVRHKISFLIGKKGTKWYVFDNKESNSLSYEYKNRPTTILFSFECDAIIEFGELVWYAEEYFAIVEVNGQKKLFIISDTEVIYESDYMREIHSSHYLLTNSKIAYDEKYLKMEELSNDYFVIRSLSDKWQIFNYDIYNDEGSESRRFHIFKSSEFDYIKFINEEKVEILLYLKGRTLFNTMHIFRGGNMYADKRWKVSPNEERNCNWVAVYDFEKDKEGVVIEEHTELFKDDDPIYGESYIERRIPEEIVIPFDRDYARVFYSEKNPIVVLGTYTGKRTGDFIDAANEIKCAVMNTRKQFLSSFIFDKVSTGFSCNDLTFHIGDFFADINLTEDDLIYSIPFLKYDLYDNNGYHSYGTPFKNVKLFIDTETTGLPLNDKLTYTNVDNWPFLVQVALIIEDDNFGILAKRSFILKPENYTIPASSTKIHGISNKKANDEGENRDKVISFLDKVLYCSDVIIGHNIMFDINVIKAEIIKVKGLDNSLFTQKEHKIIDTMKMGVNICKLPNLSIFTHQNNPYKYPKLNELYYKLFNRHFSNQHNAMSDIQATYDCYYKLMDFKEKGL